MMKSKKKSHPKDKKSTVSNMENTPLSNINTMVQDVAGSMSRVANAVADLGVRGDADQQMKLIKQENDNVLNHIRKLYNLPPAEEI